MSRQNPTADTDEYLRILKEIEAEGGRTESAAPLPRPAPAPKDTGKTWNAGYDLGASLGRETRATGGRNIVDALEQMVAAPADWLLRTSQVVHRGIGAAQERYGLTEEVRTRGAQESYAASDLMKQQRADLQRYGAADTKLGFTGRVVGELLTAGVEYGGGGRLIRGALSAGARTAAKETTKKGIKAGVTELLKDAAAVAPLDIAEAAVGPENTTAGGYATISDYLQQSGRGPLPGAHFARAISEDQFLRTLADIGFGMTADAVIRAGSGAVSEAGRMIKDATLGERLRQMTEAIDDPVAELPEAVRAMNAEREARGQLPAEDKTVEGLRNDLASGLDMMLAKRADEAAVEANRVARQREGVEAAVDRVRTENDRADYERMVEELRQQEIETAPRSPYSPIIPGTYLGGRRAAPVADRPLPTAAEVATARAQTFVDEVDEVAQFERRQAEEALIAREREAAALRAEEEQRLARAAEIAREKEATEQFKTVKLQRSISELEEGDLRALMKDRLEQAEKNPAKAAELREDAENFRREILRRHGAEEAPSVRAGEEIGTEGVSREGAEAVDESGASQTPSMEHTDREIEVLSGQSGRTLAPEALEGALSGDPDAAASVRELYTANEPLRDKLREKYGETITLYRATTPEGPTSVYVDKRYAQRVAGEGAEVEAVEVPVERILHAQPSSRGGTVEYTVANDEESFGRLMSGNESAPISEAAVQATGGEVNPGNSLPVARALGAGALALYAGTADEDDAQPLAMAAAGIFIPKLTNKGKISTMEVARRLIRAPVSAGGRVPAKAISGEGASKFIHGPGSLYHASPEQQKQAIVKKGLADMRKSETHPDEKVRNAGTWYRKAIRDMEKRLTNRWPELADDNRMTVFKALLAITSPNNKPAMNMKMAGRLYENWRFGEAGPVLSMATPNVPAAVGWRAYEDKLWEIQTLYEDALVANGGDKDAAAKDVADALTRTEQYRGKKTRYDEPGMKPPKGPPREAPYAVEELMGPKTGRFFLNMVGHPNFTTTDVWATRTMRRYLGYMHLEPKRVQTGVEADGSPIHGYITDDKTGNVVYALGGIPTDAETQLAQESFAEIARRYSEETGKKWAPMDVQARLWYLEKDIYKNSGAEDSDKVDFAEAALLYNDWANGGYKIPGSNVPRDETGTILYSTPVVPALRTLATRQGSAAALGAFGLALQQSDDEKLRDTGAGIIGLAALHGLSPLIKKGHAALGRQTVETLRNSKLGYEVLLQTNPNALLPKELVEGIQRLKEVRAQGAARGRELGIMAEKLGPEGDRLVSDLLEDESWETGTPEDADAVMQVAAQFAQEMSELGRRKVEEGVLHPETFARYTADGRSYLPRKHAHWEALDALGEVRSTPQGGRSVRIDHDKQRSLDQPLRDAELEIEDATGALPLLREAAEAYRAERDAAVRAKQGLSGVERDRAAVEVDRLTQRAQAAEADLRAAEKIVNEGPARLEQLTKERDAERNRLGEIRESSYRIREGMTRGMQQVGAAEFLKLAKNVPGSLHPDYERALDDFLAAKQMAAEAGTKDEADAARAMLDSAKEEMDRVSNKFLTTKRGQKYVKLPDSKSLGVLRGAVVTREVAQAVNGLPDPGKVERWVRWWKKIHTVYNVGTHIGNTLSNPVAAHMGGLNWWEQPFRFPAAVRDMKTYGEATRALAESGDLNHNVLSMGAGDLGTAKNKEEQLQGLLETSRPETQAVLEERGVEPNTDSKALKGAKWLDDKLTKLYNNEDNVFRVMIYQHARRQGLSKEAAIKHVRSTLGDYTTNSPALRALSGTVAPFIMYPAKVASRVAANVIEHPFRWLTVAAGWAAIDMYSKAKVGEIDEKDVPLRDRRGATGYLTPGLVQLPFEDEETGGKAAIDMSRYTPFSAFTNAAPPGAAGNVISDNFPAILTPSGPMLEIGLRTFAIDPYTGEKVITERHGLEGASKEIAKSVGSLVTPSMLNFHLMRVIEDVRNEDPERAKNDALGFLGAKPRYIEPGDNRHSAAIIRDRELREAKTEMRRKLRRVKGNSEDARKRRGEIRDVFKEQRERVLTRYNKRVGRD